MSVCHTDTHEYRLTNVEKWMSSVVSSIVMHQC
jgi:hypothetical protein